MTDMRQGILNPLGVNVLRTFPGSGTVVWGARTIVDQQPAFQQWRYVPVRRMALFIEQTLAAQPRLGRVRAQRRAAVDRHPASASRTSCCRCSASRRSRARRRARRSWSSATRPRPRRRTSTNGIVNIVVGFRPLKPAEFVIIKIAQLAGQAQA